MVKNGIDRLLEDSTLLKGRRIGLITNPSGVTAVLELSADVLARELNVTVLFGPEHGIRGDAQAGDQVGDNLDSVLNIPVFSLYGSRTHIPDDAMALFDVLVYDIQDVGARFYTYMSTLAYAMEDAAAAGKPVVVLDRVNPLGDAVEGTLLEYPDFSSFVGKYPIPVRYGLTIGEYARYINSTFGIHCDLTVIPCAPHDRSMHFPQTGHLWIPPSPNIPTYETSLAYIGTCLFEGTNISEGRGTCHPFELIGAPFIDAQALVSRLNALQLPGIAWRPAHFTPQFSKYVGKLCHGVQIYVTDSRTARPFEAGLLLCDTIRTLCPDFAIDRKEFFNKLLGTARFTEKQDSAHDIIERARREAAQFKEETRPFRLY